MKRPPFVTDYIDGSDADGDGNFTHDQLGNVHIDLGDRVTADVDLESLDFSLEDYYRTLIEDAENGDKSASRRILGLLVGHLSREPGKEDAITTYPEIRSFLARRINDALEAKQSDVGKILGLGLPPRKRGAGKWSKEKEEFIEWYLQRIDGLGLTREELWADAWKTELEEVNAWIVQKEIAPDDSTITNWRRQARELW